METTNTEQVESSEPLDTAEDSSVNWEEMAGAIDSEADGYVEGDVEVLDDGAATVATEATEPAAAPAVEPQPAVVETQPVAAPEAPVPAAQEPFDAVKWEQEQLGNLEQLYQLSEEEQQAFLTEPEKTLPKLAAAMHMRVTKSILNAVQSLVPQMIQQTQSMSVRENTARSDFFSVNSDLNKPEYEQAILQVGQMFRQVNPKATKEEAVKRIGELVRVSLGLQQPQVQEPAQQPQQPQSVRPFSPARGGGGGVTPPAAKGNMWEQMAGEFDDS